MMLVISNIELEIYRKMLETHNGGSEMVNIGWIIASVGTTVLMTVVGVIVIQRMLQDERSGIPLQEKGTKSHELLTLGRSLVVIGIVFGTERIVGYSLIGAGVVLSIISVIWSKKAVKKRKSESVGG